MVNHFRTLLLNLSDAGNASEFITPKFTARPLSGANLMFYKTLFPVGGDRTKTINLGQAYLSLITGAGLEEAFSLVDPRISYDLNTDFANFQTTGVDFKTLSTVILGNPNVSSQILTTPGQVDTTKYDRIWLEHPNLIYRVAALIVSYVLRLT